MSRYQETVNEIRSLEKTCREAGTRIEETPQYAALRELAEHYRRNRL